MLCRSFLTDPSSFVAPASTAPEQISMLIQQTTKDKCTMFATQLAAESTGAPPPWCMDGASCAASATVRFRW